MPNEAAKPPIGGAAAVGLAEIGGVTGVFVAGGRVAGVGVIGAVPCPSRGTASGGKSGVDGN